MAISDNIYPYYIPEKLFLEYHNDLIFFWGYVEDINLESIVKFE
jgi:hypothetical protein